MVAIASFFLPDPVESPTNAIRDLWDRVERVPGGKAAFSFLIGKMAPYSGTISARVVELRRGYCRTEMDDRRAVRNHLRCVHAIALANLIEITGNVGLAYSLPDDARFIVAGMSVEYLKKARGRLTGTSESPMIDTAEKREYLVPVRIADASGEVVATGTLRTLVGPKKRA